MALCFLQEKGRRESEGPKSRRRPSGRSPTSAEKRMSFESTSSLPEVSGRQGRQVCRWGFQARGCPVGPMETDDPHPQDSSAL